MDSEKSLADHNAEMKNLIRWTIALERSKNLDEILHFIRQELKPVKGIKDPLLIYSSDALYSRLAYFQGNKIIRRPLNIPFEHAMTDGAVQRQGAAYFANELGRPVSALYSFNLTLRTAKERTYPQITLVIEHGLETHKLGTLIKPMELMRHSLALAVDRVMLESQMKVGTWIWEQTFDHIEDPIVLINVDGQLLRSNETFKNKIQEHLPETFWADAIEKEAAFEANLGSEVYRVNIFAIDSAEVAKSSATNFVFHFENVTLEQDIRSRLIQNEKMIAVGSLANRIAHEINNPLTGIRSLAQILIQDSPKDARMTLDLIEVEKAVQRSQEIIKNLLEFTEASDGSENAPADLFHLIEKTLPFLKMALRHLNVDVENKAQQTQVQVQSQLLQQVIFNLIQNAAQATPEGGKIRIELSEHSLDKISGVRLAIVDTGAGISKENQSKLFQPFFTTKPKGQGTGLGLSISRSIVEKFSGRLTFESETGKGSTFYLWLPLKTKN